MGIDLVTCAYGPAAFAALHARVAAAKRGDPLAPVSVVVPTNYVGVSARRLLASGDLGPVTDRGPGLVGVTFLTLYRMAELLGAPRLAAAGRRPVSTPVVAAAVRRVLADDPGGFAGVTEHPATEEALVRAHRELCDVSPAALDALARTSRRAADVVRVHRSVRRLLAPAWYDERDLFDAALEALGAGSPVLADLGSVVLHLPERVTPPAARMVRAAADAGAPVTVVAGHTGVERADRAVALALARLGLAADPADLAAIPPVHGTRVRSVSDADEEVRAATREVLDATRAGLPLERVAVLWATPEPYARLVHEHLAAAGVPHHGAAVRSVAESLLGRAVLGLLALPDRDFARHDVLALLADAPIRGADRRLVPSARWERISRRAGVVRGVDDWRRRLDHYVDRQEAAAASERARTDREPHPERAERERDLAVALRDFVAGLADRLDRGARLDTWSELAAWAHRLVRDLLGSEAARARWPAEEVEAAERVEAALDRLGGLDAVGDRPTLAVFRRTLELELDAGLGRVGRFGEGVLVGHVGMALGVELDRVVVLGLAEGTFPARRRDDSLLPDTERSVAGDELPRRADRTDDDHRQLLAALAATSGDRVLCFPRGDLRRSTERMPSRFLLDTVEALHGTRLWSDDLVDLRADWWVVQPSFAGSVARLEFPATEQEYALAALLAHTRAGGTLDEHPLAADPVLGAGLACARARASDEFTRFDGHLGALAAAERLTGAAITGPDAVVSATRLERWAACPWSYLMEYVLRVEVPERPEEVLDLSALDRGSLVHEVLDAFVGEVLAGGAPAPGEPWSAARRARLRAIAEAQAAGYEDRGLTGRALFWRRTKAQVLRDLDRFLDEDDARRARSGLRPLASELTFGLRDDDGGPVEVPLGDGQVLRFRGAADRVDAVDTVDGNGGDGNGGGGDGGRPAGLLVVDYKTGSDYPYKELDRGGDPCVRGTKLQLPVYALAARRAFGHADTVVGAAYWFVSSKRNFWWLELPLDDRVALRLAEVLRAIAQGMEGGLFPCRLDPPSTAPFVRVDHVDPDGLGTRDRYREWERKRHDPALAAYVALAEPDQPAESPGGNP